MKHEFSKVELPKSAVETQPTDRLPAALVKATPERHSGAASFVARKATASAEVAQSSVAESPALLHFFIATFAVKFRDGKVKTQVIEVPHTSNRERDTKAAWAAVRKIYPELPKDNIRRTGRVQIVSRPVTGIPVVEIYNGQTIRQLFPDKTEFEAARVVGSVIFDGSLCDIVLRHIRAKGAVSITVRASGGQSANFSQQHNTQQLASELPRIIEEELDGQAENLKLFFVTKKP